MSFLTKTKSKESYKEWISTEPRSTQTCKLYAIENFEKFSHSMYDDRTSDQIIEELTR